jgi:5-methylcytosine-specific restriction endonuclease McrA
MILHMATAPKKTCSKCNQKKPVTDFHKDSSREDGRYPLCKACRKPLTTAQYAANRDRVRVQVKARYEANPEKHRARSNQYRKDHPEYFREYLRQYYEDHRDDLKVAGKKRYWSDPEKHRATSQAYRDANREKVREGVRDWFRRHPHAASLASTRYRARLARVENTLKVDELVETLEVFNHRCGYCLVDLRTLPKGEQTWDHIEPLVRGGSHTQGNLIPCCKSCNSRKKDRPITFMLKYLEPSTGARYSSCDPS